MASSILETLGHTMDEDDEAIDNIDLLSDTNNPNNGLFSKPTTGSRDYQDKSSVDILGETSDTQGYSYDDFEDFETSTSDMEGNKSNYSEYNNNNNNDNNNSIIKIIIIVLIVMTIIIIIIIIFPNAHARVLYKLESRTIRKGERRCIFARPSTNGN